MGEIFTFGWELKYLSAYFIKFFILKNWIKLYQANK